MRNIVLEGQRDQRLAHLFAFNEERSSPEAEGAKRQQRRDANLPPAILFLYTFSGKGHFSWDGQTVDLEPGMFLLLNLPSRYRCWLSEEAKTWRYFKLVTTHSFIVERLDALIERAGTVAPMGEEALPMVILAQMYGRMNPDKHRDHYTVETDLIHWMIELERHVDNQVRPPGPKEQLLADVYYCVTRKLDQPIGVAELAQRYAMSRSNFSHFFKTATGISPSEYILQVRLEAVIERFRDTRLSIKEIAAETGFTDATHLRRCFLRKFQLNPKAYRKQLAAGALI